MYSNIVFSGGAVKGSSFIGCLMYLEEQDLLKNFKNILGSSSGSIMALFVVLSYNSHEIQRFIETNLYNVFDIKMKDMLQIYKYYGLDDGKRILNLCEKILEYRLILVPQDRKAHTTRAKPVSCQLPFVKTCKPDLQKKEEVFLLSDRERESALAVSTVVGLVCLSPCQACRVLLIDR